VMEPWQLPEPQTFRAPRCTPRSTKSWGQRWCAWADSSGARAPRG